MTYVYFDKTLPWTVPSPTEIRGGLGKWLTTLSRKKKQIVTKTADSHGQTGNGEMLADFCAFNNMIIGGSVFPQRRIHKAT